MKKLTFGKCIDSFYYLGYNYACIGKNSRKNTANFFKKRNVSAYIKKTKSYNTARQAVVSAEWRRL